MLSPEFYTLVRFHLYILEKDIYHTDAVASGIFALKVVALFVFMIRLALKWILKPFEMDLQVKQGSFLFPSWHCKTRILFSLKGNCFKMFYK